MNTDPISWVTDAPEFVTILTDAKMEWTRAMTGRREAQGRVVALLDALREDEDLTAAVLVVDDNLDVAEGLARSLAADLGVMCLTASGRAGVRQAIAQHRPAVLVVDLDLGPDEPIGPRLVADLGVGHRTIFYSGGADVPALADVARILGAETLHKLDAALLRQAVAEMLGEIVAAGAAQDAAQRAWRSLPEATVVLHAIRDASGAIIDARCILQSDVARGVMPEWALGMRASDAKPAVTSSPAWHRFVAGMNGEAKWQGEVVFPSGAGSQHVAWWYTVVPSGEDHAVVTGHRITAKS